MVRDSRPRYHIDYPIQPEHHPPMYLMHKWWARKPHNIMAEYIQAYSLPNDIIFDPFMGSGVVPIEAIHLGRRAIGLDINPMSAFIAKNTGMPFNIELIRETFDHIQRQCYSLKKVLYGANCPRCHLKGEISHLIFNHAENSDVIQEVWVKCEKCGIIVTSDNTDPDEFSTLVKQQIIANDRLIQLQKEFDLEIPVVKFTYSEKGKFLQLRHKLIKLPDGAVLFTNRALLMLSKIRKEISTLSNPDLQNLLLFAFSSTLGQASKMVWVIEKRKGKQVHKQVGSWTHHFYWNPDKYFEVNAWNCFEERVKKVIRGKIDANSWMPSSKLVRYWNEVWENANHHLEQVYDSGTIENRISPFPWIISQKASDVVESKSNIYLGTNAIQDIQIKEGGFLPPESVDLIVTDPPYGDSIQYYELSKLWNQWLGFSSSPEKEIVINSRQDKDLSYYQSELKHSFQQCYKILKPERFLIVTFHNSSFDIRNSVIAAILSAGFELQHVLFQIPPRRSLKAYLHPKGTPIGDYYIRFYKGKVKPLIPHISEDNIIPTIRSILINILKNRGEPTSLLWIANLVDSNFARAGLYPFPEQVNLQRIYSHSDEFSLSDGYLWLKSPPTTNGVPLTNKVSSSLEEFFAGFSKPFTRLQKKTAMWHILQNFNGDLTPDPLIVRDLIEQIAKT